VAHAMPTFRGLSRAGPARSAFRASGFGILVALAKKSAFGPERTILLNTTTKKDVIVPMRKSRQNAWNLMWSSLTSID